MDDVQKLKMLNRFAKDFAKLMAKYPDVRMYGNMDGDVKGYVNLAIAKFQKQTWQHSIDLPRKGDTI